MKRNIFDTISIYEAVIFILFALYEIIPYFQKVILERVLIGGTIIGLCAVIIRIHQLLKKQHHNAGIIVMFLSLSIMILVILLS